MNELQSRMIEDIEVCSCFYDAIIISDVRLKKEIIDFFFIFLKLFEFLIYNFLRKLNQLYLIKS